MNTFASFAVALALVAAPAMVIADDVPYCAGHVATVYVNDAGIIVGGKNDGKNFGGGLKGTDGPDVIVSPSSDVASFAIINGLDGDDIICGSDINDWIYGDGGDDNIHGFDGTDLIYGGAGDDNIEGGLGYDNLYGDAGDDNIHGGPDKDNLFGDDGDDRIQGGHGDDLVIGGAGADYLCGTLGNDTVTYDAKDTVCGEDVK